METISSQYAVEMEQYEEKIIANEKEIKRREKNISDLIEEIEELKAIQNNEAEAQESAMAELLSKIHHLKSKLADSEAKDEGNTAIFVTLEEKLAALEGQNTELIHQNGVLSDQLVRKEKQCMMKTEQNEDLTHELESIKKTKGGLFAELLAIK